MHRAERLDRASLVALCRSVRENAVEVAKESPGVADLVANLNALHPEDRRLVESYMTGVGDEASNAKTKPVAASIVVVGDDVDLRGIDLEAALREHFPEDLVKAAAAAMARGPVRASEISVPKTPPVDDCKDHDAALFALSPEGKRLARNLAIVAGFVVATAFSLALIVVGLGMTAGDGR